MTTLDVALEKFDASKAKVRKEIRDGFFDEDGSLSVSENDLRLWIADRAVDELKVVLQLATVVAKSAHLIPPHILVQVTEQMSDEARHFDILRALVPRELHGTIDAKVAALPTALDADPHWASLVVAVEDGDPFAALLDVNIVHEGYSAAAIEELKTIPFDDIREAYAGIGTDEEKHHESGRELLLWLGNAAQGSRADQRVATSAHERTEEGGAMSWQWPEADTTEIIETAHKRADKGGAMSWSWP
ncbi:MAG: ferritin-like domain-containing protein [Nocardioidaceae bacterium]